MENKKGLTSGKLNGTKEQEVKKVETKKELKLLDGKNKADYRK